MCLIINQLWKLIHENSKNGNAAQSHLYHEDIAVVQLELLGMAMYGHVNNSEKLGYTALYQILHLNEKLYKWSNLI